MCVRARVCGLSPCCGGEAWVFQYILGPYHLESCAPGRVTFGEAPDEEQSVPCR